MLTWDSAWNGNCPHTPTYENASLGQQFLINDAGDVSPVYGAAAAGHASSSHHSSAPAPAPTLVGPSDGFQIDLVWGRPVAKAPSGFMQAIIDAAEEYAALFASSTLGHELIKIRVGYGEIDGTPLASNALGESESYGYLTNYATVTNALEQEGYTFSATNEPTTGQFFVTSAEAKTLGLVNPTSGLDGYIGFAAGGDWNTTADVGPSNTGTSAGLFDLQAVAAHEISEVMGRIGMEGEIVNGQPTYTPLDLFNYKNPGVLELSPSGGYFSVNDGATTNTGTPLGPLGVYNDAAVNGGDIADWASILSITQSGTLGLTPGDYDAYDAFAPPGVNGDVSEADIIEDAALGYRLTSAGAAAA